MPALRRLRERIGTNLSHYQGAAVWLRITLALAWAGLIWWLSSRTGESLAKIPLAPHVWNVGHVFAFGVLCGLILLSSSRCTPRGAVIAVILTAAYGALDEYHQGSVKGRHMDIWDLGSDTVGACLAACLLLWAAGMRVAGWLGLLFLLASVGTVHMASV